MKPEKLVKTYIDAWNRRDLEAILALMDSGASHYDAFWMETCTGRDLARYYQDDFAEQPYRYEQIGDLILTESGVTFRYRAHELGDHADSRIAYSGAEVLTLRDGLIVTVSDYYCHPDQAAMREVAELTAMRHGVSRYANGGLSGWMFSRFRDRISTLMERDDAYLDPALTVSKLAALIECPEEHVVQTIVREYGSSFDDFVEQLRISYARDLLQELPDGATEHIIRIASETGFDSMLTFRNAFKDKFGVTPTEYVRQHTAP